MATIGIWHSMLVIVMGKRNDSNKKTMKYWSLSVSLMLPPGSRVPHLPFHQVTCVLIMTSTAGTQTTTVNIQNKMVHNMVHKLTTHQWRSVSRYNQ